MAIQNFDVSAASVNSPSRNLRAVTPHASADLPDGTCKAVLVGGAGNIEILAEGDTATVVIAVPAGALLPIRAKSIRSGSTTATGIVALY